MHENDIAEVILAVAIKIHKDLGRDCWNDK